jgi:hypothetical protein
VVGGDFSFNLAVSPLAVNVLAGAGLAGTDRITITFAEQAIVNDWLITTFTPLSDTFAFGHVLGDANGDGVVNSLDTAAVLNDLGGGGSIEDDADLNKDGTVNLIDYGIARDNAGTSIGTIIL